MGGEFAEFGLVAGATAVVVLGMAALIRRVASARALWRSLDRSYSRRGVPLSDHRSAWERRQEELGERALIYQSGHVRRKGADLAILEVAAREYALKRAVAMIATLLMAFMLAIMYVLIFRSSPLILWAVVVALPVIAGQVLIPMSIKSQAKKQREVVSAQFGTYLRLAFLFIANGRPGRAALKLASQIAKDSTFQAIKSFMERGESLGQEPSEVFTALADAWHHEDLRRAATTLHIAEAGGAMKQAILSLADSIAERNRHRRLEQANLGTQRAQFPQALLASLVMLYLLYPAVAQI